MPTQHEIACPACGHADVHTTPVDIPTARYVADSVFVCRECCARTAYGTLMPRVVVKPHRDANGKVWLRKRYQDPKTKADLFVVDLDPQYAATEAKNVLSVVIP